MRVIHPGNRQVIVSPRDAVDCVKYGRNPLPDKDDVPLPETDIRKGDWVKLDAASRYPLPRDKLLCIYPNIPTWYIAEAADAMEISRLEAGTSVGPEEDVGFLRLMNAKGVLNINGKNSPMRQLPGRYIVRSDNVALMSITQGCNLECPHCVANAVFGRVSGEMDYEKISSVIKEAGELRNPYGFDVERKIFLSGGEPFLRNDLEKLARDAINTGLSTHINTNGLRISEEFLRRMQGTGLSFVISLDGGRENHEIVRGEHTYDRTIEAIKKARKFGFDVFLNTFLHQENFHEVEQVTDFAAENGVYGVNFIRAIPRGRGQGMEFARVPDKFLFRELYRLMKQDATYARVIDYQNTFTNLGASVLAGVKSLNCGLSREDYFFLDSKGNMFPCPGMRFDEFIVGNVNQSPLKELMRKREESGLPQLSVDNFPKCSQCDFKYNCGGDCRGSAYINAGRDLHAPVPYCGERIDSLLELFTIFSEDPAFLRGRANAFAHNAYEEASRRESRNIA